MQTFFLTLMFMRKYEFEYLRALDLYFYADEIKIAFIKSVAEDLFI